MNSTLNVSGSSYSLVKKWDAEFKMGRTSTSVEPCAGRSVEVTTPKFVQKNRGKVLKERKLKFLK